MGFLSNLFKKITPPAKPVTPPPPPAPAVEPKKEVIWERPRRKTNQAGIELIKSFEGLELKAYPDPGTGGDPWTIGYGHTGPEVVKGNTITKEEAERLLRQDLDKFEQAVEKLITVPLTDNQFAALVSFAYNCGPRNLENSTLRKKLQARDYAGAAEQFKVWVKAAGKTLPGLVRRRNAESQLFLTK